MTDRYEALRKAAEAYLRPDANREDDLAYKVTVTPKTVLELLAERDALAAQVEALKVDAENYIFLRDGCGVVGWKSMTGSTHFMLPSGEKLDAAIAVARRLDAPLKLVTP